MANHISHQLKKTSYYLYIDGVSSRDLILGLVTPHGELVNRRLIKQGGRTEKLLPALVKFLDKKWDIKGLLVIQDGGSFSQARLVCVVANALAYAWGVPARAIRMEDGLLGLISKFKRLKTKRVLAVPVYYGPGVG